MYPDQLSFHQKKDRSVSGLLYYYPIKPSKPFDLRLAFKLRTVSSEILLTFT